MLLLRLHVLRLDLGRRVGVGRHFGKPFAHLLLVYRPPFLPVHERVLPRLLRLLHLHEFVAPLVLFLVHAPLVEHPPDLREVAADGLSVRLPVANLREYYVHEIKAEGVRSAADATLLHDTAYYTLNQIPAGDRIVDAEKLMHLGHMAASQKVAAFESAKRNLTQPKEWGNDAEVVFQLRTLAGLMFDRTLLKVRAGQRVQITLTNPDEMLHNWLLTTPGKGLAGTRFEVLTADRPWPRGAAPRRAATSISPSTKKLFPIRGRGAPNHNKSGARRKNAA